MLGETANIRCASVPYFQIFIIPEKLPYYKDSGKFCKWEQFTQHNVQKYLRLSEDNIELSVHTPTKTLLYVINLPEMPQDPVDRNDYVHYYQSIPKIKVYPTRTRFGNFHPAVVFNDYDSFADKLDPYPCRYYSFPKNRNIHLLVNISSLYITFSTFANPERQNLITATST